MAYLPPALQSMVWSCRRPVRTDNGFTPCGCCKACKITDVGSGDEAPPKREFMT